MQFVDKVCLDALRKSIENNVMEDYKENIVYQWLRKPCMAYSQDKYRLTPDGLFYMSFGLLDLLKQYNRYDDCRLQNEIQCIPYDIEEIIDMRNYNGDRDKCFSDRMFVLLALSKLLRLLDNADTDKLSGYLNDGIEEIVDANFLSDDIYPTGKRARMTKALTTDSPIFVQSSKIMRKEDFCEAKEEHLIDYIERYMQSDRRISTEITTLLHTNKDKGNEKENPNRGELRSEKAVIASQKAEAERLEARVKELEVMLEEKEREIAAMREGESLAESGTPIRIAKGMKAKTIVLLAAMFYAKFFESTDKKLTNRDHYLNAILRYGFGEKEQKSLRQTLDNYEDRFGKMDGLKQDLRRAVDDTEEDMSGKTDGLEQDFRQAVDAVLNELKSFQNEEKFPAKPHQGDGKVSKK